MKHACLTACLCAAAFRANLILATIYFVAFAACCKDISPKTKKCSTLASDAHDKVF